MRDHKWLLVETQDGQIFEMCECDLDTFDQPQGYGTLKLRTSGETFMFKAWEFIPSRDILGVTDYPHREIPFSIT